MRLSNSLRSSGSLAMAIACSVAIATALAGCQTTTTEAASAAPTTAAQAADSTKEAANVDPPRAQITFGNGDQNWIVTDGVTRTGATLTFPEVQITGDGWLVLHPFRDGKPVGDTYVGSTFLRDGKNRHVEITVDEEPDSGDMFLVMLHSDVNRNQEFDFVFVDERNDVDKAVFEGTRMIAHPIAAP